jgi:hypothetical protein
MQKKKEKYSGPTSETPTVVYEISNKMVGTKVTEKQSQTHYSVQLNRTSTIIN